MTTTPSARRGLRAVLGVDAAFEGVLTVGCLVLAYHLPTAGTWALPSWLGRPALLVIAGVLAVAAGALAWLSGRADPDVVRAVAAANTITAVVALIWAALGADTGAWLRIALVLVAAGLAGLAGTQFRLVATR